MDIRAVRTNSGFGRFTSFGVILFLASFPVLFFNEGRAVHRAKLLLAGHDAVLSLATPNPGAASEGRLVAFRGPIETDAMLEDSALDLHQIAVRYERHVEMYQWRESATARNRYSYSLVPSDEPIDATRFREQGHLNPPMPLRTLALSTPHARVGAFELGVEQIAQLDAFTSLEPTDAFITYLSSMLGRPAVREGDGIFVGRSPSQPEIGDLRIRLRMVASGTPVSALGRQRGNLLVSWRRGDQDLEPTVRAGVIDASNMLAALEDQNAVLTWMLRVLGFLAMWAGLAVMLRPASVGASVLPFVDKPVSRGVGLVTFSVAVCFASITVACGWIAYRPVAAVGVAIFGALVLAGGLRSKRTAMSS